MPKCRGLDVDVSVVDGEEGGSSDGVFFLGMMSTAGECLHACRHAVAGERESGDAGVGQVMACRSFTWKGGEAEDGLAPCVGSEGGGYTPTLSVGSVSGNVESEECAAPKECTVLEWRLTGSFELGGENRTVLSGRSCSICGWVGCEVCAPERACPSGSRVRYLDDPHRAREADVVLVPATGDLENFKIPQRRDAGQAIVAIAGESSIWWTHVEGLREDKRFDLVMGYSRAMSDMHASYVPSDFAELARGGDGGLDVGGLVQPTADIVHFASNCNSEVRQAWVEEVMSHVSVDSYGKCNTNKKLPPELVAAEQRRDRDAIVERFGGWFTAQGGQAAVKRAVVSLYRFGLAFENTVEPDYITEKLFEVMRVSRLAACCLPHRYLTHHLGLSRGRRGLSRYTSVRQIGGNLSR